MMHTIGSGRRIAIVPSLLAATLALALLPLHGARADDASACIEVKQHHLLERDQLNARTLNDLLFEAAREGCPALVEQFLGEGASVKARNRIGNTALVMAARAGHADIVELLLARGAAIDQPNLNGLTALLAAVSSAREQVVATLLAAGADTAIADARGVTPLIAAAYIGNEAIARRLVEAGADAQGIDETGKGAIVYACSRPASTSTAASATS
jgi:ankyrin repeat protein